MSSETGAAQRPSRQEPCQDASVLECAGAGSIALFVAPSLGLVIYKMGGNNGQYDPNFTSIPQPEPSHARDDWKPIQGTPFIEGSRGGDDGIRRVLEMVSAAVVPTGS